LEHAIEVSKTSITTVAMLEMTQAGREMTDEELKTNPAVEQEWVKTDLFPTLESEKGCVDLSVIPGASQRFDFQQQALSVSIPQL
ncbi:DUF416 family protein, partial [Salmonella enterica subsp. enterica serovar Virginia]|nr:DUF416 family protein [Salmonella enterica subsp. enterica serovar Virginia]